MLAVDDMEGAPLPAIVVGGPLPSTSLVAADDMEIDIAPVTTAAFFPGKTSGPLIVVNRNTLATTTCRRPTRSGSATPTPTPPSGSPLQACWCVARRAWPT